MTAVQHRTSERRSSFDWAIRAAWLLALLAGAVGILLVLLAAGNLPERLAGNPITASIETSQTLHAVGHNSYGGSAFVADSTPLTATQITAQVRDAATSVRVGLAFGPLIWALTGTGVAICLTLGFGRFVGFRADAERASKWFAIAALITAAGTSAGQILDEIARTGLEGVVWHGANGIEPLGNAHSFTFQFGWLAAAVGLLAVAAIASRTGTDPDVSTPALLPTDERNCPHRESTDNASNPS